MKKKKAIYYLLILICICAFGFSVFKITGYLAEDKQSHSAYEELKENAVLSQPTEESKLPIEVDFENLKAENADIIAWLYCENTPINYPVMKSKDNLDYLRHLPDGSYNRSGALFLDCGYSPDFSDFKSVIYGHNMKNDSMFGSLLEYKNQSYYNEHPTMYLLTPGKGYLVELLAGFEAKTGSAVYSSEMSEENEAEFFRLITEGSDFKSNAFPDLQGRYVILSTCSYSSNQSRYVVIGKLTEIK